MELNLLKHLQPQLFWTFFIIFHNLVTNHFPTMQHCSLKWNERKIAQKWVKLQFVFIKSYEMTLRWSQVRIQVKTTSQLRNRPQITLNNCTKPDWGNKSQQTILLLTQDSPLNVLLVDVPSSHSKTQTGAFREVMKKYMITKTRWIFTLTVRSQPADTMIGFEWLGENLTQDTQSEWPSSWIVYLHSARVFHNLMVLSRDPETICLLSTEKATLNTS